MPADTASTLYLVARLLLGGAFIVFGLRNTRNLVRLTDGLRGRGLPMPNVCAVIGVALQIVSGLLIAIGPWPVLGGIGLIVFLILATVLFHPFWAYPAADRLPHVNATIMNTSLVGAALAIIAGGL